MAQLFTLPAEQVSHDPWQGKQELEPDKYLFVAHFVHWVLRSPLHCRQVESQQNPLYGTPTLQVRQLLLSGPEQVAQEEWQHIDPYFVLPATQVVHWEKIPLPKQVEHDEWHSTHLLLSDVSGVFGLSHC